MGFLGRLAVRRTDRGAQRGVKVSGALTSGATRRFSAAETRRSLHDRASHAGDVRNSARMWPVGWEAREQWGDDVARIEPLAGGVPNDVWSVRVKGHLAVGRLGARSKMCVRIHPSVTKRDWLIGRGRIRRPMLYPAEPRARDNVACNARTPPPDAPAMIAFPCYRSGSTRTASAPKLDHVAVQDAGVRFRFVAIATRPYARSAGRSSAWPATSNGAVMGKSLSPCRITPSGSGWCL